jgi:hypothetical protein
MERRVLLIIALLFCAVPSIVSACEPILPLAQLLGGSSFAGPMMLTKSMVWLFVAVAIKCFSFVFLERRLTWPKAALFMLVANVLSTIPGVLIAAFTSSMGGFILSLPIVWILGALVGGRLKRLAAPGQNRFFSSGLVPLAFTGIFILSVVLFGLAGGELERRNYASYWVIKFIFVTLVACTGMAISAVLEEYVIAQFTRKTHANQSFYVSVFRANYITLGCVLLVAALQLLPRRLNAPHFIVSWLHSISSLL